MTTQRLSRYLEARAALLAQAVPGTGAACALAALTDEAVSALAETAFAGFGERWAIVATGAYGARRLLPRADLDLLVVTDASSPRTLKGALEQLLYPLWDAGLAVGHQVRTVRDHVRACREDLESCTATLTGRVITGDVAIAEAALAGAARDASRRSRTVLRSLTRRHRSGSPYDLEPDLKGGAGGQRDLDELVWRSALALGRPVGAVAEAAAPTVLTPAVLRELELAQDRITAARWRAHTAEPRATNTLTLETGGLLEDPAALHEALAAVAEVLCVVRGELPAVPDPLDPLPADALLRLLSQGRGSLDELERAARKGALDGIVPGFAALMCLRRPALAHQLTVGAHSLLAACLVADAPAADEIAARVLADADSVRVVLAAALAHDSGKIVPGTGHAERGQDAARSAAHALGLGPLGAERCAALVREHLLLAETAAHADLDDEGVIRGVAERLRDPGLLGQLYVLTLVDSLATGPGMWSDWHAALVRRLVRRLEAALAPGPDVQELRHHAERTRLEAFVQARDDHAIATFIADAPHRYLLSRAAGDVLTDARLLAALGVPGTPDSLGLHVTPAVAGQTFRLTVATWDQPRLLAFIAGSITLTGLDVLDAEVVRTQDGAVLTALTVTSATGAPIDHWRWATFERTLRAALDGHLALTVRLAERRRHYARADRDPHTFVAVDDAPDGVATLTVRTPDRSGLLYDIADEVAQSGFAVLWAKASVRAGVATDTFRLLGPSGAVVAEPGRLGHLAARLRERCTS